jgi:uncharacterized repeat protein (TIGR01451 family)
MKKLLLILILITSVASAQHSTTLTWTWSQGTGDPAAGFHVWKIPISGTTCPTFGSTPYATVNSITIFTYVDTVVTAGQTICYGVTAFNTGGDSLLSNIVSATTPFLSPTAPNSLSDSPK